MTDAQERGSTPRPLAERLRDPRLRTATDGGLFIDYMGIDKLLREAADALDAYERLERAARALLEVAGMMDDDLWDALAALDDLRRSQKETR